MSEKSFVSPELVFFEEVRAILRKSRKKAYRAVNSSMVEAYWLIGKRIVIEEQKGKDRAKYGEKLIRNLSIQLNKEFGKGFSYANLKNFRQFYSTFANDEKGYTLCSLLSWSHIRLIMRLDDRTTREYYLTEAREQDWSVRQLERNIKSGYYQRLLSTRNLKKNSSGRAAPAPLNHLDFLKDPYILEFLGLPEDSHFRESSLEQAIISNLQHFLLELGNGFSFVGRQYRISTETSHFYIDLVFYNYILKCFVVVDLKIEKLTHQDVGQMDMYVRMFDDLKRGEGDNPTIGIILCADKDETVVKYSVLKESEQLFASKYKTVLPTEEELVRQIETDTEYLCEMRASYSAKYGEGS
jgi:predicted nuclease of restriction endonuclease-like (RecB) superfamily